MFARQLRAFFLRKGDTEIDAPSSSLQMARCHQSVATIVSFARERDAAPGLWEKLNKRSRDSGTRLLHERFDFNATRESRLFGFTHLGRA
jgi:hypothetical protein